MLLVATVLLAGCHGDPAVRKQKYFESGKRYSSQGKYREAAIQFLSALKVDKNYPDAHYELAQTYVRLGYIEAAYGELARTVDLQPANYRARIDLGNLLVAAGKIDDAQAQAKVVMATQPGNPELHALLSAIALKQGQKDQALIEIRRALELEPNRAAFHEDLALLQSGNPAAGSSVEDELKQSVALDPKSLDAKLMLAAFYLKNSRWQEAERLGRDAVATDPKSVSARAALAQVFLSQGDQQKAVTVLRQASKDLSDNPEGVRLLAIHYVRTGQTDKAKAEFAALVADNPQNLSLQKDYVRILLQMKDDASAQTVIAKLVKKSPKDSEVATLNGIALLNDDKPGEAVDALQSGAKNFPKDPFIQYWLGKAALAKGDTPLAERSFHRAVELNPTSLDAQQELARLAVQRNDMALLGNVADSTIAAAPHYGGGYVWRAMVELRHDQADKAEADLKSAMSAAPQNAEAYLELGKLRFAQKKYPDGASLLEQALQYDPNSIEALRLLISYDLFQKKPDAALARLNAQIARYPANSTLYDLLAEFQIRADDLDKAAATAQKAIQINPNDGEAVMLFAQIQVQRKQLGNAISAWEQWRDAHPNDAAALALLGTLEESRGDSVKAEAYYKKSLQLRPQQPIAANNLAYRMLQNGENVDVALTLAQTARQRMPNLPSTADTLAWAYYYKGTYGFARDLLEEAVKTEPNNATMHYHLGMVYTKLGDKSNASLHLKRATVLAPDSSVTKDARSALQGAS